MKISLILWSLFFTFSGLFSEVAPDSRPLAIIRRSKPELLVKHGNGAWIQPGVAEQLFSGDSIKTGADGYAAIQFMDNSLVKVKPNSILAIMGEVRGKDNTASRLAVQVGEVFLNVTKQKSDFEVGTPSAVAAVKGTKGNIGVDKDENTTVDVIEGQFEVTTSNGEKGMFRKGQRASVSKSTGTLQKTTLSQKQIQQTNSSYNDLDKKSRPKTMKIRFVNKDGESQELDVEYFEESGNKPE